MVMGVETPIPHLPSLRRMLNIRGSHVAELLQRCRQSGCTLPLLDTLTINVVPPVLWDWSDLALILPTLLRTLHIRSVDRSRHDGYAMLDALSTMFPNLEEFYLPVKGSVYHVPLSVQEKRNYGPFDRAPKTLPRSRKPHLDEIVRRFPRIRSVVGVDAGLKLENIAVDVMSFSEVAGTWVDHGVGIQTFLEASYLLSELHKMHPRL